MTITKLLYKKIICVTKKDIVIQKHDYSDDLSSYFLKINDNETPRSYHDPKVPAHDV